MYILGIETSCDDTSVSIVQDGKKILSCFSLSQYEAHKIYQGIVPEIASREHLKAIYSVTKHALEIANISLSEISAIAVTNYPGLIGSLVVGLNFAKGLAYSYDKPLIPINHLVAHFYSNFFENNIEFPFLGLIISGGHTAILIFNSFEDYIVAGKTIDDSCGEAFDKVAKYFNLGYPGGPVIDKIAKNGDPYSYNFPLALSDIQKYGLHFSFSGIKTAVIHFRKKYKITNNVDEKLEDILASFQYSIAKTLLLKVKSAIKKTNIKRILVAGGSAANSQIRKSLSTLEEEGVKIYFPPINLCSDNGAMVAGLGFHYYEKYKNNKLNFLTLDAESRMPEMKRNNFKT
ncbi:MAG: tRNA (adenosine(37)-N6)-threonylcarbamoyltransferase complex transferase subunit TsaD [Exilispira sp.]